MPDSSPLRHDPFLTRRGFLGVVAGTLGATAITSIAACAGGGDGASDTAGAGGGTRPDSGMKPDSGTRTASAAGLGFGLQLYTVRDALAKDLPGTLAALQAAGYRNVETAGYAGLSAKDFKAALDQHGMRAVAMHVPIQQLRAAASAILDDAKLFGAEWVVCPWMDEQERTADGYRKVGQDLATVASGWRGQNVGVAYHNHDFEFKDMGGGKTGLDLIFDAAGNDVKAELDLYWTVKAGHDPLTWAQAHPDRIRLVHVKDAGPPPAREMMDVGKGRIDFKHILGTLKSQGLQYAFVEHDNPTDAIATARGGLAHLNTLGL